MSSYISNKAIHQNAGEILWEFTLEGELGGKRLVLEIRIPGNITTLTALYIPQWIAGINWNHTGYN